MRKVVLIPSMRMLVIILPAGVGLAFYFLSLLDIGWTHLIGFKLLNIILSGVALLVFPFAVWQMLVSRFINKDHLIFDEDGMTDAMSSKKLGLVKWSLINNIEIKRTPFGSKLLVSFRTDVAKPFVIDELLIQPLEISAPQSAEIEGLLEKSQE